MMDIDRILDDLSAFSDLGVNPPQSTIADDGTFIVHLTRNGEQTSLRFSTDGTVLESVCERITKHHTYKSLLASENFGRMREWASVQEAVLGEEARRSPTVIPIAGYLYSHKSIADIDQFDSALASRIIDGEQVNVMLVDGPAGIGKTEFIKQLALKRSRNFKRSQQPLILHVQSRGRVLTFLQDLIAFSLQTLRLSVTFDQVPILARNGLVTIAVDGFDELGDPSGYETAWAQLGDLITEIRGEGTLILAGRETFIGRERILRDIKALTTADKVDSLTLQLPAPEAAKTWLKKLGWSDLNFESLDTLFEPGAFSLRPMFLRRLGEEDVVRSISSGDFEGRLSFLIDLMIRREASKFGDPVDAVMSQGQREEFVRAFLGEIARDMADNQSEAADEVTIKWAAEAALSDEIPEDVKRLLTNRGLVMAFLTVDERPRYRRFSHSQLQNYFLGLETISVINRMEVPKYLRRNLLGADFLVTFSEVLEKMASYNAAELIKFIKSATELLKGYFGIDRGAKNLAALLISCTPFADKFSNFEIIGQHIDDALLRGTAAALKLKNCSINQFDIRDSDVSNIEFEDCLIGGLIVNNLTKVGESLQAAYIQKETAGGGEVVLVSDPLEMALLLEGIGGKKVGVSINTENLEKWSHPIIRLLERVLRYRGYWIREDSDDDMLVAKIVTDPYWTKLLEVLESHDFLSKQKRQASGRSSNFYHIRRPDILSDRNNPEAKQFYVELLKIGENVL